MAKRISYKLPDGFQGCNLGSCVYACLLIAQYNIKRGYTDFKVVGGKMQFRRIDGRYHNGFHCFILKPDGKIYDPTYEQFFHSSINEQPISDMNYNWMRYEEYTPHRFVMDYGGDNLTEEYKQWCFQETEQGEFFKGAIYREEKENPELIPVKFRKESEAKCG